jgi:hypothetical protein
MCNDPSILIRWVETHESWLAMLFRCTLETFHRLGGTDADLEIAARKINWVGQGNMYNHLLTLARRKAIESHPDNRSLSPATLAVTLLLWSREALHSEQLDLGIEAA